MERPIWILGSSARSTAATTKGGGGSNGGDIELQLKSEPGSVTGQRSGDCGGNKAAAIVGQREGGGSDDGGSEQQRQWHMCNGGGSGNDLSGTEWQHKGNGSGNVGAQAASMAVRVQGDSDDNISKNSCEITTK